MFRLISSEVLSDNWGILTKYEFELRLRNGEWQHQTRETYDRGNGATCLLFNPETTCVLLTRQFRLPVFLNGGIEALIETPRRTAGRLGRRWSNARRIARRDRISNANADAFIRHLHEPWFCHRVSFLFQRCLFSIGSSRQR